MTTTTNPGTILGREPAVLVGAITAALTLIVGFTDLLTDVQAGAITATLTAIAAVVLAVKVRPIAPTLFTGVITTGAALLGTFGMSISQEQTGILVAAATALLTAVFVRPQSTPAANPRPDAMI